VYQLILLGVQFAQLVDDLDEELHPIVHVGDQLLHAAHQHAHDLVVQEAVLQQV